MSEIWRFSSRHAGDHDGFFSRAFSVPNHWVDLVSDIHWAGNPEDDNSSVRFNVFTWGRQRNVPVSGTLKAKSFYHNFYGYVAGKY